MRKSQRLARLHRKRLRREIVRHRQFCVVCFMEACRMLRHILEVTNKGESDAVSSQ
jgi:hypothetical protein